MIGKITKVAISNRIHSKNYTWLKETAAKQERSANWLLDRLITEAREAEEKAQGVNDANKH